MEKKYEYKPNRNLLFLGLIICGGFIILGVNEALTLKGSATLRHVLTLSEGNAKIFFWAMAALFSYVFFLGVLTIIRSFGPDKVIILTKDELISPKNVSSSRVIRIPLRNILQVQTSTAAKKEILSVKYQGGKIVIPETAFSNEHKFSAFKYELSENIKNLKNS